MIRSLLVVSLAAWALAGSAPAQVDPFDKVRWNIEARLNEDALAIIDSGQFDINMQTEEGYSLLHYAAGAGNLEMVKALLERGADPTLKSQSGYTPYMSAIGTMVQAEIRKAMASWNAASAAGEAVAGPGEAAASSGLCAMVRAEPVNDGRPPEERPFLKAKDAVWYNHPDELVGLIEDCVDANQQDQYGWTLLHHAADRDRIELARILIEKGGRTDIRNKDGETAANLATSEEMKALLGPAAAVKTETASDQDLENSTKCRQKYEADAALASDSTGRMRAMRRWQQCLKTGRYW